ncbi:hypothetical protein DL770_002421 [Monosporascus sp. CRB-9-2]|nr:hypothetical protein DL770_002421 [Monosporascus sp. CRB-9-2]
MPSAIADDTSSEPRVFRASATFPSNGVNGLMGHKHKGSFGSSSSGSLNDFSDAPANRTANGISNGGRPLDAPYSASHPIPAFGIHEDDAGGPRSRAYARIRTWGDDPKSAHFPRLSKSVELMRNSYDCVVIGSGYGGGVAASRMARAGESVCVLERGKERWPGEYPNDTGDALEQVHYSGEFRPGWLPGKLVKGGDPTGMFHLVFGNGQNALVGNGLGGTSLINANVYLEADEDTLALEAWPDEIRKTRGCLGQYYKKVRDVLEPTEYPEDWPKLPKMELLKKQAEFLNMGHKFRRVLQTTRFTNGPNKCGVEMSASALTGQDATGVNDGSKNTTLVTYLADAWNWGAEMFCEAEVRYITKAPPERGGYLVYFAWHGRNRGHFQANLHGDLMWVHAKNAVFLGAGAIGTTEILLRSREMGLELSDKVGQNMSGNGDILAFGYNTDYEVNAVGKPFPSPYNPIGPCITSIIDNRGGHKNPEDGYVIEEGSIPRALAPFMQAMLELLPGAIEPRNDTTVDKLKAGLARAGTLFLGPYFRKGAIEKTQVYLIMSHDSNQAILTLKEDKPVLEFIGVGRSDHVKELHQKLKLATEVVGGTFVTNPWFALMGQHQITVHPIGGACMARDGTANTGVTNHCGEVFTGSGKDTHPGLIVTDGAIIPTALGANPLATITALAERSVDFYARKRGLEISTERNGILDLFGSPNHPNRRQRGLCDRVDEKAETASIYSAKCAMTAARRLNDGGFGFTEVMSGYIHHDRKLKRDHLDTYELAARTAKNLCETARLFVSVQSFNTRSTVHDPEHRAMLTGTFICPSIPGSPFMVRRGNFNLFLKDHKAPGTRNLTYDFDMRGVDGKLFHFHGYKVVDSSVALAPLQFWKSTTTLYVTITEGVYEWEQNPDAEEQGLAGRVIAKGIMGITPQDFMSEILTMTPTGSSMLKKAVSATKFFTFFARKSMSLLLAPFTPLQYPTQSYKGFVNDTLPTRSYEIRAEDGVLTRLHMWEPTNNAIKTENLFMIPGAAVDHQIFALPTIRYNAVNYFRRAGYRVFIMVHRIGALMAAQNKWTTFDARLDIKASLEYIRKNWGEDKIYTIAHCMGSVAFATGLLDGTIPASWIKGVTCSQVFMNPIWNTMNLIKVLKAPAPLDRVYRLLGGTWFSCSTGHDDSYVQKALNEVLRLMPDERREICNNASCHRCTLVFGRCWNHRNLNEATHRQIDRFFGGVNMTLLHLLMRQGVAGGVMANAPLFERLDTADNIRRHLGGLPFLLFVGRDNAVLSPESTQRTYEALTDIFGTTDDDGVQYRRRVVPGYGHLDCWMGRNAWKDVYPFVREEVDRVVRGEGYSFEHPDDEFRRMVEAGELVY